MRDFKEIRVAVAGTGYVGLSIALPGNYSFPKA